MTELSGVRATEIRTEILQTYERYVAAAYAKIKLEVENPDVFLAIRSLPTREQGQAFAQIRRGEISLRRLRLREVPAADSRASTDGVRQPEGLEIRPDGALIHHWAGAILVPMASIDRALDLARDYDDYKRLFSPDIVASGLRGQVSGSPLPLAGLTSPTLLTYLRVRLKKIITLTVDTEHEVRYRRLDADHAYSIGHATRVREMVNPGKSDERLKRDGDGSLWRLETIWRYQQVAEDLYIEHETIALTRTPGFPASLIHCRPDHQRGPQGRRRQRARSHTQGVEHSGPRTLASGRSDRLANPLERVNDAVAAANRLGAKESAPVAITLQALPLTQHGEIW